MVLRKWHITYINSSVEGSAQRPVTSPLMIGIAHTVLRLVLNLLRPEWEVQQVNDENPAATKYRTLVSVYHKATRYPQQHRGIKHLFVCVFIYLINCFPICHQWWSAPPILPTDGHCARYKFSEMYCTVLLSSWVQQNLAHWLLSKVKSSPSLMSQ